MLKLHFPLNLELISVSIYDITTLAGIFTIICQKKRSRLLSSSQRSLAKKPLDVWSILTYFFSAWILRQAFLFSGNIIVKNWDGRTIRNFSYNNVGPVKSQYSAKRNATSSRNKNQTSNIENHGDSDEAPIAILLENLLYQEGVIQTHVMVDLLQGAPPILEIIHLLNNVILIQTPLR